MLSLLLFNCRASAARDIRISIFCVPQIVIADPGHSSARALQDDHPSGTIWRGRWWLVSVASTGLGLFHLPLLLQLPLEASIEAPVCHCEPFAGLQLHSAVFDGFFKILIFRSTQTGLSLQSMVLCPVSQVVSSLLHTELLLLHIVRVVVVQRSDRDGFASEPGPPLRAALL